MDLIKFLQFSFVFLIGILAGFTLLYMELGTTENPFSLESKTNIAPQDWVPEKNIHLYPDRIIIDLPDASISRDADTGSMKPLFDKGANGIRIVPKSEEQIKVGDIITYEREGILIVHRIVEKGTDQEGTYFITQGDNNTLPDGKVRFKDVKYVTVAVVY